MLKNIHLEPVIFMAWAYDVDWMCLNGAAINVCLVYNKI